jgi:hypothetical protein
VTTSYGTTPAELIEYIDESYPLRVLQHVWYEQDHARDGLVAWLEELGGHPTSSVRVRVAVTVGLFTKIAYDHMRTKVISSWAQSDDQSKRDSAAIALGEAIRDARLIDPVRRLVTKWAQEDGTWVQTTAARTYAEFGPIDMDRSLSALERLSVVKDIDTMIAACRGFSSLTLQGGMTTSARVLRRVHERSTHREDDRREVANWIFLWIAADLVPLGGRIAAPEWGKWPALLRFGSRDPAQRSLIIDLWASALSSGRTYEIALEVLDEWAKCVERDREAVGTFAILLGAVVQDSTPAAKDLISRRLRFRLTKQAKTWADGDSVNHAPRAAAAITAVLSQGGPRK